MDYRRATAANTEDNCEYYNRMLCRSLARERKQPVIAFDAIHQALAKTKASQWMKFTSTAWDPV